MKYVPSALIGQLSRSQGSTTASRNRFGSYFRNRVMPVNPNTTAQQTRRNNFQENSQGWRALSSAQRLDWSNMAQNVNLIDSLGQTYHPTGAQLYISINTNLDTLGSARVSTPPALPSLTTLTTVALTVTAV